MEIIKIIYEILEGIFGAVIDGIFDCLKALFFPERKTEYSAEFDSPAAQLQHKGGGFRIGYTWGNSLMESHSHMIVLGGSGSKKSSCVCFNTLLQSHDSSFVIFDCARELFGTATYLKSKGYEIFSLDYDDSSRSIGFNWLEKCANETEVYKQAQVLIGNSKEDSAYDYWMQTAENLIGLFAYALLTHAPEYANMANVLNMIQVFSFAPKQVDAWLLSIGDQKLSNRYKSLVATPQKTLLSTVSTALNALSIYNTPNIAAITSKDTLPFDMFRQKRCALFISGSPAMSHFCRGVSACFFESFFSHILQKIPGKNELPITFLIDEASTVRLQTLPKILELGRKHRISICTLWQDYNQVEHIFGKNQAANILANSKLKAYMPSGQPIGTCKALEEILGRYTFYTDEDQKVGRTRELLTAQEIFQLQEILVLNGNAKPLLLKPKPYFENSRLRRYTEMPRYEIPNTNLPQNPPLLQF